MIIQWFADMFYKVLTGMLNWINLPNLPESLLSSILDYIDMFSETAYGLFRFFVPYNVIKVGIPIVLVVVAFNYGYYFVMWILKKIPVAGIN